jgi:hypothetical protein
MVTGLRAPAGEEAHFLAGTAICLAATHRTPAVFSRRSVGLTGNSGYNRRLSEIQTTAFKRPRCET